MKARHICAVLGIAIAVGAVVFVRSLIATNDHQSVAMAERMLKALPVEANAKVATLQLDFRPEGRVLQGPPMIAVIATQSPSEEVRVKSCGREYLSARRFSRSGR